MTAKIAILFPGQGSQEVGMGQAFFKEVEAARKLLKTFEQYTEATLSEVMFEGPEEILKQTRFTQPAIVALSAALYDQFRKISGITPDYLAGHSVGELSALYAAEVISADTLAQLVGQRSKLMESAPNGLMAAVLGLSGIDVDKAVMRIKNETQKTLTVANYNSAEQVVISGEVEAIELVSDVLKEFGAKRIIQLPVSGAFHSPLMKESSKTFAQFIQGFTFQNANIPVITNVDAQITTQAAQFQEKLGDQICESVQWSDSMSRLYQAGVKTFVEIGPGKVLTTMMKRVYKDVQFLNIDSTETLNQAIAELKGKVAV